MIFRPAPARRGRAKTGATPCGSAAVLPPGGIDVNYCDCGWPYHLLLPRGLAAGMPCRVLVMLTDRQADLGGAREKVRIDELLRRARRVYPDQRRMGYPFDRPFALPVTESLKGHAHIATREIKIVHG